MLLVTSWCSTTALVLTVPAYYSKCRAAKRRFWFLAVVLKLPKLPRGRGRQVTRSATGSATKPPNDGRINGKRPIRNQASRPARGVQPERSGRVSLAAATMGRHGRSGRDWQQQDLRVAATRKGELQPDPRRPLVHPTIRLAERPVGCSAGAGAAEDAGGADRLR